MQIKKFSFLKVLQQVQILLLFLTAHITFDLKLINYNFFVPAMIVFLCKILLVTDISVEKLQILMMMKKTKYRSIRMNNENYLNLEHDVFIKIKIKFIAGIKSINIQFKEVHMSQLIPYFIQKKNYLYSIANVTAQCSVNTSSFS